MHPTAGARWLRIFQGSVGELGRFQPTLRHAVARAGACLQESNYRYQRATNDAVARFPGQPERTLDGLLLARKSHI